MKIKNIIILENIKSNEVSVVFSKIVSKGLCCDKFGGFRFLHRAHLSVVFTESHGKSLLKPIVPPLVTYTY